MKMETFTPKVSSKPSVCYLDPISLTPDRLDASYYAPEFLEDANAIEKSHLRARSLASISGKVNCGATPKLVIYKDDGLPLIRTSNVRPNLYSDEDVLFVQAVRSAPAATLRSFKRRSLHNVGHDRICGGLSSARPHRIVQQYHRASSNRRRRPILRYPVSKQPTGHVPIHAIREWRCVGARNADLRQKASGSCRPM